jgi:hypothetical protein
MNRTELLEQLRDNQTKHAADYREAMVVWKKKAAKALAKAAKKAEKGKITLNPLQDLPKPVQFMEEYDDAIARVMVDTREELELDDHQFRQWVQDKWVWQHQFAASTSLYNGR